MGSVKRIILLIKVTLSFIFKGKISLKTEGVKITISEGNLEIDCENYFIVNYSHCFMGCQQKPEELLNKNVRRNSIRELSSTKKR